LLPRTFSLPANAHGLEAARPLAVFSRRLRLEIPEAKRDSIRTSPVRRIHALGTCKTSTNFLRQSAARFQIGEQAVHLGVAVQPRQHLRGLKTVEGGTS